MNLSFFHSLLKSCSGSENSRWAVVLFRHFLQSGLVPNDLIFSLLIKACGSSLSSPPSASASFNAKVETTQLQAHLEKCGFNQFVYVRTSLIDLYMKLGCIANARKLFEDMSDRDVVSWNAMICGYSRNGFGLDALELFVQMCRQGLRPHQTTAVSLIPSCGSRELIVSGRAIHGLAIKAGLDWDHRVKNVLTSMYAKCADLEAAEILFEEMIEKTVVSWNTMIGAYGQNGFLGGAMLIFKQMLEKRVETSHVTIVSLLSADAFPEHIHCHVVKIGIAYNKSIVTSLVCAYARRGSTDMAELLDRTLPEKNLVSLTAIISSLAMKGDIDSVVQCFVEMLHMDMKLDAVALISILHGIKNAANYDIGCSFHGYGLKSGLTVDCLVANGLISMYFNFDEIEAAFALFLEMQEKPLITWNSMISGCVQAGQPRDAMELFYQMKASQQIPDSITISSLLSGCCQLGYLRFGKRLHNYVLRNKIEVEAFVGTALIDMYTKCGSIEYAERVFKSSKYPCLATYNSIISGYSLYGLDQKAFGCYFQMLEHGLKPDKITFLGVLAACTHRGLVHEGRLYFLHMTKEFGLVPDLQHYASMVGLFGRAGLFEEALQVIENMKIAPDSAVWGALLNACCIHEYAKLGECLAKKLLFLDYKNGGFYVLMSNLYAVAGRWDDVTRVRDMMRDTGGDGCSGASVIEFTSFEGININLTLNEVNSKIKSLQHVLPH